MSLGKRLRAARTAAGLTIADVATKAGLTPSHISQVERDLAKPSIGALHRICEAVGIRPSLLLRSDELPAPTMSFGVVRRNERRVMVLPGSPIQHELLCPDLQHSLEAIRTCIPPGSEVKSAPSHPGEEWLYVVTGTLEVTVGSVTLTLEAGDALYFDAGQPHSSRNPSDTITEVIWVATPPHL